MKTIVLSLAEINIQIIVDAENIYDEIIKKWGNFISKKKTRKKLIIHTEKKTSGNINALEKVWYNGEKLVSKNSFNKGFYSFKEEEGEINITKEKEILKPIRLFLMKIWGIYLLEKKSLLMHGCGIVKEGKAYLFSGPAGVGKTTIAKKNKKEEVLNDECVIINTSKNTLQSTFFSEKYVTQERTFPLQRIFFLKQGTQLKINQLKKTESFYNILKNEFSFMIFEKKSPIIFKKVIRIAKVVVEKNHCMELESRKKDTIWEVVV